VDKQEPKLLPKEPYLVPESVKVGIKIKSWQVETVLRPVSHGPQPRTNRRKLWRQFSELTGLENATKVP
jgi:hypothetical protein